jgi:hypothetical protein
MSLPKKNKAAAVLRKQAHIEKRRAEGASRNAIRKELIADGMPKMSRAYFNEIVSDFAVNKSTSVKTQPALETVAAVSGSDALDPPQSAPATAPSQPETEVTIAPRRTGNAVDDRFTGGY